MWRLPFCCCGCSLRSGALTVAIITLVSAVYSVIAVIGVFAKDSKGQSAPIELKILYTAIVVIQIVDVICLFLGVCKSKPIYCLVWLFGQILVQILVLTATALGFGTKVRNNWIAETLGIAAETYNLIIFVITFLLMVYWWLVVFSFYVELKEKENAASNN